MTNFTDTQRVVAHSQTTPKVKVLLSYGEHAREFLPVESLFHLLENLTAGLSQPHESPAYSFSSFILSRVRQPYVVCRIILNTRPHTIASLYYVLMTVERKQRRGANVSFLVAS